MSDFIHHTNSIKEFYKGFPKKGYYVQCLNMVKRETEKILCDKVMLCIPNRTVIMDVDDTLLWTRPYDMIISERKLVKGFGYVFHYDGIPQMIRLAKKIKKMGYYLIILTSRDISMVYDTITNLNKLGVYPDKFFVSDSREKSVIMNSISNYNIDSLRFMGPKLNYLKKSDYLNRLNIVAVIGDKWSDIKFREDILGVKLPDMFDMNSYFLFNKEVRII